MLSRDAGSEDRRLLRYQRHAGAQRRGSAFGDRRLRPPGCRLSADRRTAAAIAGRCSCRPPRDRPGPPARRSDREAESLRGWLAAACRIGETRRRETSPAERRLRQGTGWAGARIAARRREFRRAARLRRQPAPILHRPPRVGRGTRGEHRIEDELRELPGGHRAAHHVLRPVPEHSNDAGRDHEDADRRSGRRAWWSTARAASKASSAAAAKRDAVAFSMPKACMVRTAPTALRRIGRRVGEAILRQPASAGARRGPRSPAAAR